MRFVATCLFGLEKLLGQEIEALGCKRESTIDGRVIFEGGIEDIPRLNINLRYAERVYILLGTFPAASFTELFDKTVKLPFADFIGRDDAFPVKGHSIKSKLYSVPDCQSIVKKAAVEAMKSVYGISYFQETGEKYQIEFFILKDEASVMIDTSGTTLHKRGYRPVSNDAPLRETLAAGLCKIANLWEDNVFWDPMCGSGTIAIEAAMLMTDTAPGLNRGFAAEAYPFIPESAWKMAREEARDRIKRDSRFEAYATDIDPACVDIARENIKRAGMENYIKCRVMNALDAKACNRRGTVICNPPYGERLMTVKEAEELYAEMGKAFSRLEGWHIYVITAHDGFERLYRRRADRVRKLYNGMIKCNYYQFFKDNTRGKK